MKDLKAPGKQPLPCFLTSSAPADRPRPVPKPGMMGVPVALSGPHSRGPAYVLSQDTGEGKALARTPPPPSPTGVSSRCLHMLVLPERGLVQTRDVTFLHFNHARAQVQERKSRLCFTLAVSSCRGRVSVGWIFPGCDLVGSPHLPRGLPTADKHNATWSQSASWTLGVHPDAIPTCQTTVSWDPELPTAL